VSVPAVLIVAAIAAPPEEGRLVCVAALADAAANVAVATSAAAPALRAMR